MCVESISDVVCLSETWLSEDILNTGLFSSEYIVFRCDMGGCNINFLAYSLYIFIRYLPPQLAVNEFELLETFF